MAALRVVEPIGEDLPHPSAPVTQDPLVVRLRVLLAELQQAAFDPSAVSDAARIDRIAVMEQLRSTVAGAQMAESVRFAQSQVDRQLAADVHPQRIGRGVAEQIGLACHLSPVAGARRLGVARALWFDLPETFRAVLAGELREVVAEAVVTETRHLDAATRRQVDSQLAAAGITTMGYRQAVACARKHAYEADRAGYLARGRTERKHRRVGIRSAPDTMAVLSAYLPVEQAVACHAGLLRHAARLTAEGDERNRDQIMADTLVELLTGQTRAEDLDIEIQLTMPLDGLLDPDDPDDPGEPDEAGEADEPGEPGEPGEPDEPGDAVSGDPDTSDPATSQPSATPGRLGTAQLAGFGPLPLDLAREIIASSRGRKWWRRLFTAPAGQLVGGDPTRRRFDGWLAKLIVLRDQTCRDPFCDAPIRHLDHIVRYADGGPTSYGNGRGTCARGNQVREMPGWKVERVHTGPDQPHTVRVTTPTGHSYLSRAPNPP